MSEHFVRADRFILAIDVVESVRLMEADEAGSILTWLDSIRRLEALLPRYDGRIAKKLGDGLLIEFTDSRKAVAAAFAIMALNDADNHERGDRTKVLLRIAIAASSVLYAGGDVYGHGINVAMRLLSLAGPGEIVATVNAREGLTDTLDAQVTDLGECFLKHVAEPVRAFRLGPPGHGPALPPAIGLHELAPVIAVMPFEGCAADLVGEVIAEELIASLSRVPEFRVISRLSTRALQARDLTLTEIAAHLGAHYVVSGTYRFVGDVATVDAELSEARTGSVVWADRRLGPVRDFVNGMSAIIGPLLAQIGSAVLARELRLARSSALPTLDHYTLMVASIGLMHRLSRSDFVQARRMLDELIGRASRQALPQAWLANWHVLNVQQGWSEAVERDAGLARQATKLALDVDPECSLALTIDGFVHTNLLRELDVAAQRYELAIEANPSSGLARSLLGTLHAFRGEGAEAVANVEAGLRMSPFDPHRFFYDTLAAGAYYSDGQYERAVEFARRSLKLNRRHTSALRILAVCLQELDRGDEARTAARQLMLLEPTLTVSGWLGRSPAASFANGQNFAAQLRKAGVPE